jgi:hypothetical protein
MTILQRIREFWFPHSSADHAQTAAERREQHDPSAYSGLARDANELAGASDDVD